MPVTYLDRPSQRPGECAAPGDAHDAVGSIEHDALDLGVGEVGDDLARCDDRALGELAHLGEGLLADEEGDQRSGAESVGWTGARPVRHLNQGVSASLADGASVSSLPVIEVQRPFQALQLVTESAATDRVQHAVQNDLTAEGGGGRRVARGVTRCRVMLGGHDIGSLAPVVDDLAGVRVAQPAAVAHQHPFVLGEPGVAPLLVGFAQQVDLIGRDCACGQRPCRDGHGAQLARPAHQRLGRPGRKATFAGQR